MLAAFGAAAITDSFTVAAKELVLTQLAINRQVNLMLGNLMPR